MTDLMQSSEVTDLEKKLDELYTEIEKNYPPNTFNFAEQQWNDGFYRGQLKALELVSLKLFGKNGDELAKGSSEVDNENV